MGNLSELMNVAGAFGAAGIFVILVLDRVQKMMVKRGNGISTDKMIRDLYLGKSPANKQFETLGIQLSGLDRTLKRLAGQLSLMTRENRSGRKF